MKTKVQKNEAPSPKLSGRSSIKQYITDVSYKEETDKSI
jgi:hypothetical protein